LLVEDQVMFKELLGTLLEAENLIEVVAAVQTVRDGIAACHRHQPDLLLLDLALPDGSGLDVARALAECRPEAQTIIISGQADTFRCPPDLKEHIYSIVDKTRPFAVVRQELLGCLGKLSSGQNSTGDISRLSPREVEVFRLIGRGLSSKEIAAAACISPQTVATHRKKIAAKLGLRANALVRFATLHGLTANTAGRAKA
jgi:DNA-binding NarL/FixJ family response regulator